MVEGMLSLLKSLKQRLLCFYERNNKQLSSNASASSVAPKIGEEDCLIESLGDILVDSSYGM